MAWTEDDIVEGLAEAMWREAHDPEARAAADWLADYDWVRAKWRRYARAALVYLGSVKRPDPEEEEVDALATDGVKRFRDLTPAEKWRVRSRMAGNTPGADPASVSIHREALIAPCLYEPEPH